MRNENERSKSNSVKQKTKEEEKRYHFVFCSFLKKAHVKKTAVTIGIVPYHIQCNEFGLIGWNCRKIP